MDYTPFYNLGIALGLGLLVGLQRERSDSNFAGIRTFALITMSGSIAAYLAIELSSGWIVALGTLCVALLALSSNYLKARDKDRKSGDRGQTTETAAIFMFLLGAYIVVGSHTLAVAAGAVTAVLLYLKPTLSNLIHRMDEKDTRAIMLFVVIVLVILPVLPDKNYGPYNVLNPREIWLMVTLIVGISVAAYFAYSWLGKSLGTIAGGLLGGLISSTATTVSYAQRAGSNHTMGRLAAMVIMIASTVSFVRIIIEVGIVIPGHLATIVPPVAVLILFMAVVCFVLYHLKDKEDAEGIPKPDNPAQLKSALIFGALYALIIVAVAAAKDHYGDSGLYVVAIISGFTDVDAITLSLSNTIKDGNLDVIKGRTLILIAGLANMLFKMLLALALGGRRLGQYISGATVLTIAAGLLIVWLWPAG